MEEWDHRSQSVKLVVSIMWNQSINQPIKLVSSSATSTSQLISQVTKQEIDYQKLVGDDDATLGNEEGARDHQMRRTFYDLFIISIP